MLLIDCAIASAMFKVLLFATHESYDFEVHRNWLAITHSLPLIKWYSEKTSVCVLDYPPLFAYIEYLLSFIAAKIDPEIVVIRKDSYVSAATIVFQRTTTILGELLLLYALVKFVNSIGNETRRKSAEIAAIALFLSPSLLIIDHIHFQYNGFLLGFLVLSLHYAQYEETLLLSAGLYTTLICLKHLYLVIAPAYAVFLFRRYCLKPNELRLNFKHCANLAVMLICIFTITFGPFAYYGQLGIVMKRLFPLGRGLLHPIWPPNFWALYASLDRTLLQLSPTLGLVPRQNALNALTRGIEGECNFAILPQITPKITLICVLVPQSFYLIRLSIRPTWTNFIATVTLCAWAAFMFGFHIHEKAILTMFVPLSMISVFHRRLINCFKPLAIPSFACLFPLMPYFKEYFIRSVYPIIWLAFLVVQEYMAPLTASPRQWYLDRLFALYLLGYIPFFLIPPEIKWNYGIKIFEKYEFLSNMTLAVYCYLGIAASGIGLSYLFFFQKSCFDQIHIDLNSVDGSRSNIQRNLKRR